MAGNSAQLRDRERERARRGKLPRTDPNLSSHVTAPAAQAIGSTKQLQAQAVLAFTEYGQFARRAVTKAWECGKLFTDLKEVMEHGEWIPWLEANKISRRTASHFMRLHHSYPQMGKVVAFESVDTAIKAIPRPPQPETDKTDEPKELTAHEKWLVERDELLKENRVLKVELQESEQKAAEREQLVEHYESELKVEEGFAKGRDVLESRQDEIRRLKHRIYELEGENGSLLKENQHLKRQLKRRERELAQDGAGKRT